MQSITDKVISRVYGNGRGWVFSQIDFTDLGSRSTVDQALSRLARKGTIRRLSRGIYDYPSYSQLLGKDRAPDMQQVAQTIARKYNWDIVPDGSTSTHMLGLDTQVPAQYRYFSSGPNKIFKILGTTLVFVHRKQQHTSLDNPFAAALVQALYAIGENKLDEEARNHLASLRSAREYQRIVRQTRNATSWVHDEIKDVAARARGKE